MTSFIIFFSFLLLVRYPVSVSALYHNQRQDGNQPRHILADPAGLNRYHSIDGLDYWAVSLVNVDTDNQLAWLPSGHIGLLFISACDIVAYERFDKFAISSPQSTVTIIIHLTIPSDSNFDVDKVALLTCTIVERLPGKEPKAVADYTWRVINLMNNASIFKVKAVEKLRK